MAASRRVRVVSAGLCSYVLHLAVFAFVAEPFSLLVATLFLAIVTRLFCIELFYRLYHWREGSRPLLLRLVRPRNEGAYICPGGESTLFGNLFLLAVFFWPFTFYALGVLSQQTTLTLSLWTAYTIKDLATGALIMDFDSTKQQNFGYNLGWMFSIVFFVGLIFVLPMVGAVLLFVVSLLIRLASPTPPAWLDGPSGASEDYLMQLGVTAVFLLSTHLVEFGGRLDKQNVDWSGVYSEDQGRQAEDQAQ